jgi:3-phosphoglycerate kinase
VQLYSRHRFVVGRPMGVFEFDKFASGTLAAMNAAVAARERGAVVIIGMSE